MRDLVPISDDAAQQAVYDGGLKRRRCQLRLLIRVGEKPHLHQHSRHVGADQHPERCLLEPARAHRDPEAELVGHGQGPAGRLVPVAQLRQLPRYDVEDPRAAADHRHWLAGEPGRLAHFGAGGRFADRRIRVEADEQIRPVVVGDGRPLVKCHGGVGGSGQHDPESQLTLDQIPQPTCDGERDLLLQGAVGSTGAGIVTAVTRVDRDRADGSWWRKIGQCRQVGVWSGGGRRRHP